MAENNWELELNEYIRQGEPDKVDKSIAWKTAIGLQDVDGLKIAKWHPCNYKIFRDVF